MTSPNAGMLGIQPTLGSNSAHGAYVLLLCCETLKANCRQVRHRRAKFKVEKKQTVQPQDPFNLVRNGFGNQGRRWNQPLSLRAPHSGLA